MTNIKIFEGNRTINLPTLIDSRFLICANSGGGKSYAVRKLLEETHGQVMAIVLDIEGEFKSLREKYDFLLIGDKGDVPLNQRAVNLLPRKLLELNVSTIIDISDLKRHERIQYVKKFLESLMELPRKGNYWKPCLIILDEVHQLAGQQEKQDSTFAVIDLATRGRKRGYCLVGCTQRISKLHKDVVAELNNYMVGRTGLDIDQKRAGEILGFTNKQDVLSLRDLDAGEFFVFGTAISKAVIKVKVGEVQTTHPKVGMDLKEKIVPPTPKIKEILSKLSELPKEAEEQIKTTKDMQKKIRELTIQLRIAEHQKPKQDINPETISREVEKQVKEVERKYQTYINPIESNLKNLKISVSKLVKQASTLLESKAFSMVADVPVYNPTIPKKNIVLKPETKLTIPVIKSSPTYTPDGKPLRQGAMKMLGWLEGSNPNPLTKQRLATLSGFSVKGGTFNTYISELKRNGWIDGDDELSITLEGSNNVKDIPEIPTGEELIDLWISKFRAGVGKILRVVCNHYPNSISKDELGVETEFEPNGGTFNTYLSELRRNDLIEIDGDEIKASEELME